MKIALYKRVSTTEQSENGNSLPEQEERMLKYCDAMKWDVFDIYTDAGFSGSNTNRPALQRLIKDVRAHKVDKVLVYKLDRLSRSQKDTLMLIEDIFLKNGCDFVSMSENFDTSTPFGRAMIGILAVFAQLEREQIKERMSMGREARAKQGKYTGSWRHPIGYDYVDGELVVNDFEKQQIIQIFEDYESGMSFKAIAKKLNESGMTHKYGEWNPDVIRTLISRKTYLGYVRFSGEWFKGTHEPIIDESLFNSVQKIHSRKEAEYYSMHKHAGHYESYLGGLLVCKKCGHKYYKHHRASRGYSYDYYVCFLKYPRGKAKPSCRNKTWRMEELDELIFNEIRKLSLESVGRSKQADISPKVKIINEKIDALDGQITRLMDLYSLGNIPKDKLQEKIDTLNEQRNKLNSQIESLQDVKMNRSDAIKKAKSFSDILDSGDFDMIRSVLSELIEKIEIDGEDVYIYWAFD